MRARITLRRNGRGYVYKIRDVAGTLWADGWIGGSQAAVRKVAREEARRLGLEVS